MITGLSIILLGFFLGMRHATDSDHVIAVTTIVSRERTMWGAALIGILWGIGHTVTILVVGGAIILFSVVIPPRLGLTMELAASVMLVLLGLLNLGGLLRQVDPRVDPADAHGHGPHSHPHRHGDYVHTHPHGHGPMAHGHAENRTPQAWLDRAFGRLSLYQILRPVVVGLVHGLAGSAAIALLVLAAIPDPLWATAYLLVFGVGTIAGMLLITAAIALPFVYTARRWAWLNRSLGLAASLLSLGFGVYLALQIGFAEGLFTPAAAPGRSPSTP